MRRKTIAGIGLLGLALMLSLSGCPVPWDWIDSNADLSIRLTWDDENTDLDLYVTYPSSSSVTSSDIPLYTNILDAYEASAPEGNTGFFPEDLNPDLNRAYVNQDEQESQNGKMEYHRPNGTSEVIELFGIPFPYGTLFAGDYNTTSNSANALPAGYDYAWIGVMEVYVYGERGTVSGAGNVEVEIYDGNERLIASIPIDEDTYMKGLSVARIPVFRVASGTNTDYYQILLDKRLMTDKTGIRSLAAPDSDYVVLGSFGGAVQQ